MLTLTFNRELRTPLRLQISQFYFQAIRQGDLFYGNKLPSIREQVQISNVTKIMIVMAYGELMAARLIKSRHGIGYEVIFTTPVRIIPTHVPVTQGSPPTRPKTVEASTDAYTKPGREYYYRMDVPDSNVFPWSNWQKWNNVPSILKEQLFTRCHSPSGSFSLYEQLIRYLNSSRGINTRAENIIITNGIQEGLSLLNQIFIIHHVVSQQKKCHIVTEPPCHSGAWHPFNYYGADITSIAIDNHGLQTGNLPEYEAQLCYVTPTHRYPMRSVLPLERRQSLLTWAQCTGTYIIGDDYDAVFTYGENPLPALKVIDYYNRATYLRTFFKTLGPDARLGYLICPDKLLPVVQNMKALSSNDNQWLLQQFLAELMQSRVFYTYASKLACSYTTRLTLLRDGLSTLFPEGKVADAMVGPHLSLHIVRHAEFITRLQQYCLLAEIYFDTLSDIENGSGAAWCKENSGVVVFFGFGGLQVQQINKVLTMLEQALTQP